MKYPVGSILLIKDYPLPKTIKDKFFIVLAQCENKINLLSMTTSQIYIDGNLIKHGLIQDRAISLYCFYKDRKIGKNGFCFHKHTFISHRNNIHPFTEERLNELNIEYKDCLINKEFADLIYSFYKHNNIPIQYKEIFENILSNLPDENIFA
ncbi:MAG: hypothetical protein LBC68_14980 [Prevotellaceae bacterium]|jgi:hypothetical protein|nr:hypothetical protein [Prevotellaceae bacterium]